MEVTAAYEQSRGDDETARPLQYPYVCTSGKLFLYIQSTNFTCEKCAQIPILHTNMVNLASLLTHLRGSVE